MIEKIDLEFRGSAMLEIASGCLIISKVGSPYSSNEEFQMGGKRLDLVASSRRQGERESFRATAIGELMHGNPSPHRVSRNATARDSARGDRAARGRAGGTIRGRITGYRVVVKDPGQHHRTSGLFEVHIQLALPDRREVDVGHRPDADERHADVHSAINDAFKHARRVLRDQVQRMEGHVKAREPRAEDASPTPTSD